MRRSDIIFSIWFSVLIFLNWVASIVFFVLHHIPLWRAIWPPSFPGWDSLDDASPESFVSWILLVTTLLMISLVPAAIEDVRRARANRGESV